MEKKRNSAIEKVEKIMESISAPNNKKGQRERQRAIKKINKNSEKNKKKVLVVLRRKEKMENEDSNVNKKERVSKTKIAIVGLAVLSVSLIVGIVLLATVPSEQDRLLEESYKKSYYDTVEEVDNMNLNMSKVLVSNNKALIGTYLTNLAINSELAGNNFSSLPLEDESKYNTVKVINQVGDYAKYLNNKVLKGEEISESEYQSFYSLYLATLNLKETLYSILNGGNINFSAIKKGENNSVVSLFNDLENLSTEYPELIYDGPFSDGKIDREVRGLPQSEITEAEGSNIIVNLFSDYDISEIESQGKSEGNITCYNYKAKIKGQDVYLEVSVKGGKLILFSREGSCGDVKYGEDDAIARGNEFLLSLGIENAKAVWSNLSNNVFTINYATEVDGVICYADLVKVRLCAESLDVIGLESTEYYTNHVDREISTPQISEEECLNNISKNVEVEEIRLVIIPEDNGEERLCYEVYGQYDDSTYYIYIDAKTGEEAKVYKVVESGEGSLLM